MSEPRCPDCGELRDSIVHQDGCGDWEPTGDWRSTPPPKPRCDCCNGDGQHQRRAYVTASPFDTEVECSACDGTGETWHTTRRNSCAAYRELHRSISFRP